MNKNMFLGLLAVIFCFVGCTNQITTYTVTFNPNLIEYNNVQTITGITSGSTISLPENPIPNKTGIHFGGWFIDNNTFQNQFTSSTIITTNLTVYAKWIPHDCDGGGPPKGTKFEGTWKGWNESILAEEFWIFSGNLYVRSLKVTSHPVARFIYTDDFLIIYNDGTCDGTWVSMEYEYTITENELTLFGRKYIRY